MLRKNTAGQFVYFTGVNATTGAALSGATWTMRVCLDGTFAAKDAGTSISEDAGIGFYKIVLDAADTNGNDIGYHLTATNAVPVCLTVFATPANPTDGVRFGLTALPNAAAEAAGGLYTRGSGAGQINSANVGQIDINVVRWNGTAVPAEHTAGYPIVTIKDGTGTGEIDTNAGAVVSVTSVSGSVGSVTGAVGSVTGAVGSVTGNVGGNVAGSVGSVTGAVGSVTGLTASDVAAIKAKTDSLAFTVAGQVDANVQYVNDVQVTGTGASGDEWGPV